MSQEEKKSESEQIELNKINAEFFVALNNLALALATEDNETVRESDVFKSAQEVIKIFKELNKKAKSQSKKAKSYSS